MAQKSEWKKQGQWKKWKKQAQTEKEKASKIFIISGFKQRSEPYSEIRPAKLTNQST